PVRVAILLIARRRASGVLHVIGEGVERDDNFVRDTIRVARSWLAEAEGEGVAARSVAVQPQLPLDAHTAGEQQDEREDKAGSCEMSPLRHVHPPERWTAYALKPV